MESVDSRHKQGQGDKDYYDKNNYQGDEYNYDQGGTWVLIIIKT